ncbi:MAG: ABC transporter ATP-binding protein [Actinobacteria bacterium 13_1_20CM_3_68_9]|nr:MAG: ABC transporter ATP-binding protein [Actinobacteria bacterium 13_1_20CM_3_68_9]
MIAVQSLTKRYGATVAVDGLSFSVRSGSILGFLGPNGAGKTTTLRVLLGLAEPTSGSATIDGVPYRSLPDPLGSVGAVLDSSGFHPGRRGRNHLRVIARAAGLPVGRVDEVLRLVELGGVARRRVKAYSFGMKQRLNLAGALLGDPQALILDEPANGLDPQGIRWLRDFLRSMAGQGRTVLVSSHVLAEVSQTVDEVLVIHRGRLRAHSTLAELTRRREGAGSVRVRSPEAGRLAELLRSAGASVEAPEPERLTVRDASPEQVGDLAAENRIALHELVAEWADASLEEVFLELTSDEAATAA